LAIAPLKAERADEKGKRGKDARRGGEEKGAVCTIFLFFPESCRAGRRKEPKKRGKKRGKRKVNAHYFRTPGRIGGGHFNKGGKKARKKEDFRTMRVCRAFRGRRRKKKKKKKKRGRKRLTPFASP